MRILSSISRGVTVFDEAHRFFDELESFFKITIQKHQVTSCNLDANMYDLEQPIEAVSLIHKISQIYQYKLDDMEKKLSNGDTIDYPEYFQCKEFVDKSKLNASTFTNSKNFIHEVKYADKKFSELTVEPLIFPFVEKIFKSEYLFFLSATVWPDDFYSRLGFDKKDICFIDVPPAFDPKNMPVQFLNLMPLKYQNMHNPKVFQAIDDILQRHKGQRGLILATSKDYCYKIKNALSADSLRRIRIAHSQNIDNSTLDEVLEEHHKNKDSVLLSSSLWEGVDLKDELSRFQIIVKAPFMPPSYIQKKKDNMIRFWSRRQTLLKILQGFGRSIRSENDYATTNSS